MLRSLVRCYRHETPPLWMPNTPQWGCPPQPVASKGSAQSKTNKHNNKQNKDYRSDHICAERTEEHPERITTPTKKKTTEKRNRSALHEENGGHRATQAYLVDSVN